MTATRRDFLKALAALGATAVASAIPGLKNLGVDPSTEYGIRTVNDDTFVANAEAVEDVMMRMKAYFDYLQVPKNRRIVVYLKRDHPLYEMALEVAERDPDFVIEPNPPWLSAG